MPKHQAMASTKKLPFHDSGTGSTVVFLHGYCESRQIWTSFSERLDRKFRVVTLDLPGFGHYSKPVENYSLEAMADYVYEALTDLEVVKCVLIGHSLGGYVALAVAEKYPDLLLGLGLFHSSALADTDEKKENRNKTVAFQQEHGLQKFIYSFFPPLFHEENRERLEAEIQDLIRIGSETKPQAAIEVMKAMRDRPDRTHVLREAEYPVLFISGKEDNAVSLEQTLQQCHLPQHSSTLFLGQTAHMGMYERPVETLVAVEKFLEVIYGL
ncbi:alpha/beta hydrolase [soil metagenome]